MPSKRIGFNRTINRNSNGTFGGTPAWIPIIAAQGIKVNRAPSGTPNTSDRLTATYSTLPTRYKISVDFDALWNKGAGLTALRTAFIANLTGGQIDLSVLDGQPATSAVGYRGEWMVTKFDLDFPLVGAQKVSVNLQPHGNHAASQAVATYTDATVSTGTAETPSNKRPGKLASVNSSGGTPITAIRDWKLGLEWATFDAGDRADDIDKVLATQFKPSAELNFIWDRSVAALVAFETAFLAHSAYDLYLLDGAYGAGTSWGVHADWAVTDFPDSSELENGQMITVKLEPHGNATTTPTFVTI